MSLLAIILIIVALLLGAGIGIFAGISYRKNVAEKEIGSAEEEARKIVSEAMKTAEAKERGCFRRQGRGSPFQNRERKRNCRPPQRSSTPGKTHSAKGRNPRQKA